MNDTFVYSYQGVSISNSQLIANGKSYPLRDIFWAEQRMLKPVRWPSRLMMFGGLSLLFGRTLMPLFGSVLMLLGLLHWRRASMRYVVVIRTSIGEHQVLVSENARDIDKLISALNFAKALKINWEP